MEHRANEGKNKFCSNDNRQHERCSNDSPLLFRKNNNVMEEVGKISNYSKSGLNLLTEYSLTPKTAITIKKISLLTRNRILHPLNPGKFAVVKWCKKLDSGHPCYSSGLEYINQEKIKEEKSILSNLLMKKIVDISEKYKFFAALVMALILVGLLWFLISETQPPSTWKSVVVSCLPGSIVVLISMIVGYIIIKLHGITPTEKFKALIGETIDTVAEKKIIKDKCSFLEGNWVYTLKNKETRMKIYGTFNLLYSQNNEIKVQGKCWYYDTKPDDNKTRGYWNSIFVSFHNNTLLILYEMYIQRELINGELRQATPDSAYKGIMELIVQEEPTIQTGYCVGTSSTTPISGSINARALHSTNAITQNEIVDNIKKYLDEKILANSFLKFLDTYPLNQNFEKANEKLWEEFLKSDYYSFWPKYLASIPFKYYHSLNQWFRPF
ncbi:hypothetical protein [Desulfosarcina variabilis]|uniref:hypothetical protein n=1 Tax=Desulfosarcina variabilis TaxID=2300 RepID=UPI003AFB00F6